jgi:hypothetical protein
MRWPWSSRPSQATSPLDLLEWPESPDPPANDAQMSEMPEPGDLNSWSVLRARDWTTPGSGIRSHATPVEKKCSRCEETKPVSEFWRQRASPDGLYSWCRQCGAAHASSRNFPASDTGTIVCVQCRVEKSVLEFQANKRLRTGRTTLCKTCTKGRWLRLYRSTQSPDGPAKSL